MADVSMKVSTGASIAYITNGTSMAAAAFGGATIANALVGTGNLSSYPRCDLVLSGVSTSNTCNSTSMQLYIYRRDINVGGGSANDNAAPGASNSNRYVGLFNRPSTASSSNFVMTAVDIPLPGGNSDCEFWLQNGFNTNMENTGWTLTVYPKTDIGATA
jgi:hypothetical protein